MTRSACSSRQGAQAITCHDGALDPDQVLSDTPRGLAKIAGVTDVDVDVDLATGQVTVMADEPIEEARVRDAVEEAGYELVSV
ncbi:cation transporter [Nonomuraea wenchangensis]